MKYNITIYHQNRDYVRISGIASYQMTLNQERFDELQKEVKHTRADGSFRLKNGDIADCKELV